MHCQLSFIPLDSFQMLRQLKLIYICKKISSYLPKKLLSMKLWNTLFCLGDACAKNDTTAKVCVRPSRGGRAGDQCCQMAKFDPLCPHALHPAAIQGKEGIKFCHLATLLPCTTRMRDAHFRCCIVFRAGVAETGQGVSKCPEFKFQHLKYCDQVEAYWLSGAAKPRGKSKQPILYPIADN